MLQRYTRVFATCLLLSGVSASSAAAQGRVPCGEVLGYDLHVGPARGIARSGAFELLAEDLVQVPGRAWLQLEFGELRFGPGALLELESLRDGAKEVLDGKQRGRRFSAYFNGDAVRLRLFAPQRDGLTGYRVVAVGASLAAHPAPLTLCGVDDRTPSADKRVARLLLRFQNGYSFCSAFLVSPSSDGRAWDCFATSGTCLGLPGLDTLFAQFEVPASLADGTIQHPPPSAQYQATTQTAFAVGAAGVDWGLFRTLPNATTGLHAGRVQGSGFRFATTTNATNVTLLSYGTSQLDATRSGTQQSGSAVIVSQQGDVLAHRADSTGGSAGAPLVTAEGSVLAVQVEGGCDQQATSANKATLASQAAFAAARSTYCQERADFVLRSFSTSTTTLEAGRSVTFRSTIANEGSLATPLTSCGYYIGKAAKLSSADRLLAAYQVAPLMAMASVDHRLDVTLPLDLAGGACYVGAIADDLDQVAEWNEGDNVAAQSVTCVGYPNLVALLVQSSTPLLEAGQPILVDTLVENRGGVDAPTSVSAIVMSEDATITTQDRLLGTIGTPLLQPGQKHPHREPLVVPLDVKSSPLWIGLIADREDQIVESVEVDNALGTQVTGRGLPELLAAGIETSAPELRPTLAFTLTLAVDNLGEEASPATSARFVLSDDAVVSTNDVLLAMAPLAALAPKGKDSLRVPVIAPPILKAGQCFVGAELDPNALVREVTRANNSVTRPVLCSDQAPLPDLKPVLFTVGTTQLIAGQPVQVDAVVRNEGFIASLSTRVGFYLSDDATITSADLLLESATIVGLEPLQEVRATKTPLLPPSLKTGTCYIGVLVDDQNLVPETNETNNTVARNASCQARPDLVALSLVASTRTWQAKDRVDLTAVTQNRGGAQSSEVSVGYYLSDDAVIETRDTLLLAKSLAPLDAAAQRTLREPVTIPTSVQSGTCYLGVWLDRFDALVEVDEDNNSASLVGTCVALPDLVCQNLEILDTKLSAGASTAVRIVVENLGGAASPPTDIAYVLATSATGSLQEPSLGVLTLPALPASGRFDMTTRHDVPYALTGPLRFVTAFVDASATVQEASETNNGRVVQMSVIEATSPRRSLEWEPRYPFATTKLATLRLADRQQIPGADLDLTMPADGGAIYILAWSANRNVFSYDILTDISLSLSGSPMFPGWIGFLDARGRARAGFRLPPVQGFAFDVATYAFLFDGALNFRGVAADAPLTTIF